MKKIGAYGVFSCLAGILAAASIIALVISHQINASYQYTNLPLLIIGVIAAIALTFVSVKFNNSGSALSVITTMASIIILVMIAGNVIIQRILLMSGLFSYNSMNTVGWQVFYATVAAVACQMVAGILLIIASFGKSK